MDITHLLLAAGSTSGIALVALMAVVPLVMESRAARGQLTAPPAATSNRRTGHRRHHRSAPIAL